MNPSGEEKDEMEIESVADNVSESSPTDQEMEESPTQLGVATSSQPNQIPLTTAQRIAATFRDGSVPAFITTQLPNLPRSRKRKLKSRLPLLAPKKKRKRAHIIIPFLNPDSDPVRPDSVTIPGTFPDPVPPEPIPDTIPVPIPDPGYDADLDPKHASDTDSDTYSDTYSDADPDQGSYFDITVSNSDRLPIPYHLVEEFFPYYRCHAPFTIHLTDPCGFLWPDISCVVFFAEDVFILTNNWAQYAEAFNLRVMDTVRFWSTSRFLMNHFVMQHIPRPEPERIQLEFPQFLPQNFLFQVELGRSDVGFGRLVINVEQARITFPGIALHKMPEMLKLTDFRDKNWYVRIVYSEFVDRYVVMDGWTGVVRDHGLVAGDWVCFYKYGPLSLHMKHFLIGFVKQRPTRAHKSTIQHHPLDPLA